MKVITELNDLTQFGFWGGARKFANKLSYEELEILTQVLENTFPNGVDETTINDLFWFDQEWVCIVISTAMEITVTVDEVWERKERWEV